VYVPSARPANPNAPVVASATMEATTPVPLNSVTVAPTGPVSGPSPQLAVPTTMVVEAMSLDELGSVASEATPLKTRYVPGVEGVVTERVALALAPGANEPNAHRSVCPITMKASVLEGWFNCGNAHAPWLAVINPGVNVVGTLTYMSTLSARSGPIFVTVAATATGDPGANA